MQIYKLSPWVEITYECAFTIATRRLELGGDVEVKYWKISSERASAIRLYVHYLSCFFFTVIHYTLITTVTTWKLQAS
jgi:hypothetical protein